MTGSDHIRTISRIKNVAKINVFYGDLSARIYYLMSRFPVEVSITQCVTFRWYKVMYTKYTTPSRLRGRVWLRQTSPYTGPESWALVYRARGNRLYIYTQHCTRSICIIHHARETLIWSRECRRISLKGRH